jgi:hypothetical protein
MSVEAAAVIGDAIFSGAIVIGLAIVVSKFFE